MKIAMIGAMVKVRFIQSNVGAAMNASSERRLTLPHSVSVSGLDFDDDDRADEQAREEEVRPGWLCADSVNIRDTLLDRAVDYGCFCRA
jgi:hypothetical protein